MPFEQSVLHIPLIMSAQEDVAKWILLDWSKILFMVPLYIISLDWSSLHKRVIKWGSFSKTDFFCESNLSESNE